MISNWISDRVVEGSSHQGAIVVAAACAVLFFWYSFNQSYSLGCSCLGHLVYVKERLAHDRIGNKGQTS